MASDDYATVAEAGVKISHYALQMMIVLLDSPTRECEGMGVTASVHVHAPASILLPSQTLAMSGPRSSDPETGLHFSEARAAASCLHAMRSVLSLCECL